MITKVTQYLENQDVYARENIKKPWWWLRTSGDDLGRAAYINSVGRIDESGYDVRCVSNIVRPALWIEIK